MKRFTVVLLVLVVLAGGALASNAAAARPDTVPGLPVELSLGDSWAFGFGATVPSVTGYVPLLHEALQEQFDCSPAAKDKAGRGCKHLQLVNLAVGGATTASVIQGQLPEALSVLESRNGDRNPHNDVEVITLHIGGNDVVQPIIAACMAGLSETCVRTIITELSAYRSELPELLANLRDAAGPDTRIVIGTYDNPIATCFLNSVPQAVFLADVVLEGFPGLLQGLHDIIRDVAADSGVEVAEVYRDLGPQDWVGGNDCLHPDDSGYAKVASAFLEVLTAG